MNPGARLTIGPRDLVLVAGLPGAGKSTLLAAVAATGPGRTIRDSDDVRAWLGTRLPAVPYRYYRAVVHLVHQIRVFTAVLGAPGPVLVHDPATRPLTRGALAAAAALVWRPAVFVWVDADPGTALRGQHERGRTIRAASFARHRPGRGVVTVRSPNVTPRDHSVVGTTII